MVKNTSLDQLNSQQKEAVLYLQGPLLVLAGAGSGKTKVITHKFAYLLKKGYQPHSIFAVTFTNKAANEMKQRIIDLSNCSDKNIWIGTFHSQCNKILRKEIKYLDYNPDFTIYDSDDQNALIRQILKEFNMHEVLYKGISSRINILKANLISPEMFISNENSFGFEEKLARVYLKYQDELKHYNALDFDDLIMLSVKLFEEKQSILNKYTDLFRYILVDEFQDINTSQYRLIQLLSSNHYNICAVGDDDQSIYKFRGADIANILNFEKDFPKTKIIKLEQNYRSTRHILDVSGAVISKNRNRNQKKLWTEKQGGDKVFCCLLQDEEDEAKFIVRNIKDIYFKGNYKYKHFAILYRITLQSRALEDALRYENIPYHIVSGISFYHRKEIKDILSYIRLVCNSADNLSLRRIVNSPTRGIGNSTLSKIDAESKKRSTNLFETMKLMAKSSGLSVSIKEKISGFIKIIENINVSSYKNASDLMQSILKETDYLSNLDDVRKENITEFILSAKNMSVKDFLDKTSLVSMVDEVDFSNSVSLMTLHSSKGLEFPVVFIAGLEDGLLPHFKAMQDPQEIYEERRLFYVGITRAKDILYLTGSGRRRLYAKTKERVFSRFLSDIPKEYCHWVKKSYNKPISRYNFQENSRINSHYIIGCRVRHPKWGIGVIRDCIGEGEEIKITVNFHSMGIKQLAANIANLEKI